MNKFLHLDKNLIAPCGMNCGLCIAHLREKNKCNGCRLITKTKYKTIELCKMRTCKERKGEFCYSCKEFPCKRLQMLDKRYKTKYQMSQIENLEFIKNNGIKKFIEKEEKNGFLKKEYFVYIKRNFTTQKLKINLFVFAN